MGPFGVSFQGTNIYPVSVFATAQRSRPPRKLKLFHKERTGETLSGLCQKEGYPKAPQSKFRASKASSQLGSPGLLRVGCLLNLRWREDPMSQKAIQGGHRILDTYLPAIMEFAEPPALLEAAARGCVLFSLIACRLGTNTRAFVLGDLPIDLGVNTPKACERCSSGPVNRRSPPKERPKSLRIPGLGGFYVVCSKLGKPGTCWFHIGFD